MRTFASAFVLRLRLLRCRFCKTRPETVQRRGSILRYTWLCANDQGPPARLAGHQRQPDRQRHRPQMQRSRGERRAAVDRLWREGWPPGVADRAVPRRAVAEVEVRPLPHRRQLHRAQHLRQGPGEPEQAVVRRALLDRLRVDAGRVRHGGVQDGGARRLPEGRRGAAPRGREPRERQVPRVLQGRRHPVPQGRRRHRLQEGRGRGAADAAAPRQGARGQHRGDRGGVQARRDELGRRLHPRLRGRRCAPQIRRTPAQFGAIR